MSVLHRAWDLHRVVRGRAVHRVERFGAGAALSTDDLPRVWDCNYVRIDDVEHVGAADVVRLCDHFHSALRHRKVVLPHGAGEIADELGRRGWTPSPLVVMEWAGTAGPLPPRRAESVDPRAVRGVREAALPARDAALRGQIAAWGERVAAVNDARVFAAFDDGEVAAFCVLFEHGGAGEIDEVTTLDAFRGRGHGTAVVQAAVAASTAAGNDLTFLVATRDDWPRHWYARLGFRDAGARFEADRSF